MTQSALEPNDHASVPIYLALDPGEASGWATFNSVGSLLRVGTTFSMEEFFTLIRKYVYELGVKTVICENYRIFDFKLNAHSYKEVPTIRRIGAVEYVCNQCHTELVFQSTDNRDMGYMWGGIKKAKDKAMSHPLDAYAHGVYYLQRQGIRTPQQARGDKL